MSGQFRGVKGVERLLKIARINIKELRHDLADIDEAANAARTAIKQIASDLERNDAASAGEKVAFAHYAAGMRERRFNLLKTLSALDVAGDEVREKLSVAVSEAAKLDRLLAVNRNVDAFIVDRHVAEAGDMVDDGRHRTG